MILAAIDIGSNAARLLVVEVQYKKSKTHFKELNYVRIPLRLGFDVFQNGSIGNSKKEALFDMMHAFSLLMKLHNVDHYLAYATSAMRDAMNQTEVIETIQSKTGIHVQIISGDEEATIIFENHIAEYLTESKSYLYIDVGGGSTELTLFHKSKVIYQHSFNIGTIRILTDKVLKDEWDEMKDVLTKLSGQFKEIMGIGSGGNINKLYSLSKTKPSKIIGYQTIKYYYNAMRPLTVQKRMEQFNMSQDRADVIVPALQIYKNVMQWGNIAEVYVPRIGFVNGMIQHLYDETTKNMNTLP